MKIKEAFRKYLEEAIGHENALVAFSAFEQDASVSIRLNPFKKYPDVEARPVPWCVHGRILEQRPSFTLDPAFHAGAYYVQDSSSMFVGHAFRVLSAKLERPLSAPLRVLDLCAAPGGKTTDLLTSLREMCGDNFLLVSNEVMKARVGVLADNVALWGDPNVVVTSDDPKAFAALPEFFDIILADVPCSGEGMFRKDEQAQEQWSPDNVSLCEARQRRIVADVWPALKKGGLFIYSTCTFNIYENDSNVRWIADELGAEPLMREALPGDLAGPIKTELGYSLVPGFVEGEGQYCSALKKNTETISANYEAVGSRKVQAPRKDMKITIPKGLESYFSIPVKFKSKGDLLIAVPEHLSNDISLIENTLHVIASGCAAGSVKGKDFIPNADLALSVIFNETVYQQTELDLDTALAFLHRDAIMLNEMDKGFVLVKYKGLPLGFVKNLGNRCNNLHPQARRIRMNIR